MLKSSAFNDPVTGDSHVASQWVVSQTTNGAIVFDSGTDSLDKTMVDVPVKLDFLKGYTWKVRHENNHETWSDYSVPTSFSTQQAPVASFAPYQGTYRGLARSEVALNGITGTVTIDVIKSGAFSAILRADGETLHFYGVFASDGVYAGTISRKDAAPLNVSLTLDTSNGTQIISGSIWNATTTATVSVGRNVFNAKTNPAPEVGRYTLLLTATENSPGVPMATGYALFTVSKSGSVVMVGKLPNNEGFATSGVVVGGTGEVQFMVDLPLNYPSVVDSGARGLLIGSVMFRKTATSDMAGTLEWVKPEQKAGNYQAAIDKSLSVIGSIYKAKKGNSVLPGFSSGTVEISDTGTLSVSGSSQIDKEVTLTPPNVLTINSPGSDMLRMTFNSLNGSFSGSFLYPGEKSRISFGGVVLQGQTIGVGLFLGPDGIGNIDLTSP
jgi:hypothetical protein